MRHGGRIYMMIVMRKDAEPADVQYIVDKLAEAGAEGHVSSGDVVTVIGVIGDREVISVLPLEAYPGVDKVLPILRPFKLVSREFRNSDSTVRVRDKVLGAGNFALIAGPCSVENREQAISAARFVSDSGATMLRGGAFKPRTSPYAFQGLGVEALEILAEAREVTGLPIVTEVMDVRHLGEVVLPVLLKRGMSATIDEFLMAAEYIVKEGNDQVILCERGIRTFETATRNTLDIAAIPVIKHLSHLPIIVDPSHAAGKVDLVEPLSLAAVAAGADGLLIEAHPTPESALVDGGQSLNPEQFRHTAGKIADLVRWTGKVMA